VTDRQTDNTDQYCSWPLHCGKPANDNSRGHTSYAPYCRSNYGIARMEIGEFWLFCEKIVEVYLLN